MKPKYIIGVDTGKSGAAVAIDRHGEIQESVLMKDRESAVEFFVRWSNYPCHVWVEKNSSSPQMGVTSAFTFGGYCMWVEGICEVLALMRTKIPGGKINRFGFTMPGSLAWEHIPPKDWQRALSIPGRKKAKVLNKKLKKKTWQFVESQPQFKKRLVREAKRRFPGENVTDANADAILIAEAARRTLI